MSYETITYEAKGPIGVLTMNRPERRNAMNYKMRDEMRSFFMDRLTDLEVRVLVVTGAGKGFCSGVDMKDSVTDAAPDSFTPKGAYELQRMFSDVILYMRRCPQPIIGAVNGAAVGAGLSVALACDVRLAAPESKYCAGYINIGTGGADMGSSWLLTRAVGIGNAARYMLTGDFMGAEEALRIGLVSAVIDQESLMEEAMKMAATMALKSPIGLRLTKEAIDRNAGCASLEDAIRLEDRNQALCIAQLASAGKAS